MPYSPPSFQVPVNLWRAPALVTDPPTSMFIGNLALGPRMILASDGGTGYRGVTFMSGLLCPKRTDIAGVMNITATDLVEVPAGTGRYYVVVWVEDSGRSYSNEYRFAAIDQGTTASFTQWGNPWAAPLWPVPTP